MTHPMTQSTKGKGTAEGEDGARKDREWRQIETAPRDGRSIIVYRPNGRGAYIPQVGEDYWYVSKAGQFATWGRSNCDAQPTHWLPMPKAPTP